MREPLSVSVIIPTFNRKISLQRTLESLTGQTLPVDRFEVIVVDDGSSDDTPAIASQPYPFTLNYVRQQNLGATTARNTGARISRAEILIFVDDDVCVSPQSLEALVETCSQKGKVLATGILTRCSNDAHSAYTRLMLNLEKHNPVGTDDIDLPIVNCNTELLACKRSDFFDLGMLQDPTKGQGWPNWDDVEFGYRAHLHGFRLVQTGRARGEHWDYSIADRATACRRWYRASKSAVWLFNKHQGLQSLIPMLRDKTPLAWGKDSVPLMIRKLVRSLLSSQPVLGAVDKLVGFLEQHYPSPTLLLRFYHWLHGGYMFHGYREGLREFERVTAEG